MSIWNVIDSSGVIINRLQYDADSIPPNPHPVYTNHMLIKSMGHENIGYTYCKDKGEFMEPPTPPQSEFVIPKILPTQEQTDIAALNLLVSSLLMEREQASAVSNPDQITIKNLKADLDALTELVKKLLPQ